MIVTSPSSLLFSLQSFSLSSVWLFPLPSLTPYSANELDGLHVLPSSSLPSLSPASICLSFTGQSYPSPSCSVHPPSSPLFILPSFRAVSLLPWGIWSYCTAPCVWIEMTEVKEQLKRQIYHQILRYASSVREELLESTYYFVLSGFNSIFMHINISKPPFLPLQQFT